MKILSEKGFKATGTFRADSTNGCPLKCVKEFKWTEESITTLHQVIRLN